jgi:hypothetical protein
MAGLLTCLPRRERRREHRPCRTLHQISEQSIEKSMSLLMNIQPERQIAIAPDDATSADAAGLIAELSAELAHLHDYTDDGSGKFDPKDVSKPGGVFLLARLDGRPLACGTK